MPQRWAEQRWAEGPPLGTWVDNQRQCKRKLDRGDPNPQVTAARMVKLDALHRYWLHARSALQDCMTAALEFFALVLPSSRTYTF